MAKKNGTDALEFSIDSPMPDRARVTVELSVEELKQLFTLAAQNGMTDLSYALGTAANPLRANLNRLQNEWKEARKAREQLTTPAK